MEASAVPNISLMLESRLDTQAGRRILDNFSRKVYLDFMLIR